jgi:phage repressor protein C with HTH and peptisase S24 domain
MIDIGIIRTMKTVKEIRLENARLLATEGPAEFARRIESSTQQVNQVMGPAPTRNIGDKLARRIEAAFGHPEGWLDVEHNPAHSDVPINTPNGGQIVKSLPNTGITMPNEPTASQDSKSTDGRASVSARPILAWDREEELGDEYVLIPRLDVKFSAGNGKIIWHIDEKGQKQAFRRAWCQRLGINPEHAATIVNEGQSMESRIQDGDSLVVDYKATRIIDGKVYALAYRSELYVKRLFKLPSGGLIVRSDNPDKARFPDINLTPEDMEFVEIVAQVKGVSGGV